MISYNYVDRTISGGEEGGENENGNCILVETIPEYVVKDLISNKLFTFNNQEFEEFANKTRSEIDVLNKAVSDLENRVAEWEHLNELVQEKQETRDMIEQMISGNDQDVDIETFPEIIELKKLQEKLETFEMEVCPIAATFREKSIELGRELKLEDFFLIYKQ